MITSQNPLAYVKLQARVKALLRRVAFLNAETGLDTAKTDNICVGDVVINKGKRTVILSGNDVKLTAKEFDLLLYMANHPGQVFSREQLLNAVWGYHHSGYEHTVNSHINRLRAKLEADSANPEYVLTVWGVGYKFSERATH